MFGWKKTHLMFERSGLGTDVVYLNHPDGKMLSLFTYKEITPYVPEVAKLKPGESIEIEIRIKGRKC